MIESGRWREMLGSVPVAPPRTAGEVLAALDELAGVASQWLELLDGYRDATSRFGGPAARVSFDLACRRSEQSFFELEIARRHAGAAIRGDLAY